MSRTIWPVTESFPQYPLLVGYSEIPPSICERYPTSVGPDKVAVVATAGWREFTCTYYLDTQNQMTVFSEFWRDDVRGGQLDFTWPQPRTGADVWPAYFSGDPSTTHDMCRFWSEIGPPAIGHIDDTWAVTVSIRVLESVTPSGGAATWPVAGGFPTYPNFGARVRHPGSVLRGDMRQRQRSIADPFTVDFELKLTGSQLATFDSFFVTDCATGAKTFAWDLVSASYQWGTTLYYPPSTDYAKCRFVGRPRYSTVSNLYIVNATVEFCQG